MRHNLGIPTLALLLLGTLAACVPVYVTPHGGNIRADTSRTAQSYYRATDGRVFSTRAARNAYERRLYSDQARYPRENARVQRTNRRTAQLTRERQRLDHLERQRARAERRHAEAERAQRQTRREAKRARRAANASKAERLRRAQAQTRQASIRAQQAANAAERRAAQRVRNSDRISRRQQRVENLAPRPGLAPATKRKIEKYGYYRRKGENIPAFVTRIAHAERLSSREGQSVAYWLNDANHTRRRGASEK